MAIGDESSVPYIHVLLAQTECLRGAYDAAASHAEEARGRAEQGGQETLHRVCTVAVGARRRVSG